MAFALWGLELRESAASLTFVQGRNSTIKSFKSNLSLNTLDPVKHVRLLGYPFTNCISCSICRKCIVFWTCVHYELIKIVITFNSSIWTSVFACYFCLLLYSVCVSQQWIFSFTCMLLAAVFHGLPSPDGLLSSLPTLLCYFGLHCFLLEKLLHLLIYLEM